MEERNSKKILLTVLGVAILIVAVVGISFAAFNYDRASEANTITSGSVTMSFAEISNGISISDALPMTEATALDDLNAANEYFDFSVSTTAKADLTVPYTITVEKTSGDGEGFLTNEQVKVNLQKKNEGGEWVSVVSDTFVSALTNNVLLQVDDNDATAEKKTDEYRLRIWIDAAQQYEDVEGKTYSLVVNVNGGI